MLKKILVLGFLSIAIISHTAALIDVSPTAVKYDIKTSSKTISSTTSVSGNKKPNTTPNDDIIRAGNLPMSISSTEELIVYEEVVLRNVPAIIAIDAESNTRAIYVTWSNGGRFLGLVPVNVNSKTTVEALDDNSKTISIITTLPWWSFFVTDVANTAAVADATLTQSLEIKDNMKVDTSAQAKAHVIHAVVTLASAIVEVTKQAK